MESGRSTISSGTTAQITIGPMLGKTYDAAIKTPPALDIAAIQGMYGANTDHNGGNDTYVLPTANAVGTFFQAIWDTGGEEWQP